MEVLQGAWTGDNVQRILLPSWKSSSVFGVELVIKAKDQFNVESLWGLKFQLGECRVMAHYR